jgi:hypothetical protein
MLENMFSCSNMFPNRQAIVETAAAWSVTVTPEQISAAKAKGNANNDWVSNFYVFL